MNYFHKLSFTQQFAGLAFLASILIYSITSNEELLFLQILLNGLIFGLFTLIAIKNRYPGLKTKFIWILFSTLSYPIAIAISVALGDRGEFLADPNEISTFLAGLAGALILTIGFRSIIKKGGETIDFGKMILISLAGGAISAIIGITDINRFIYPLVISVWPIIISFMLASSIKKIV